MSFLLQTLVFLWHHVLLATDIGFSMTSCPSWYRRWLLYDAISFLLWLFYDALSFLLQTLASLWGHVLLGTDIGFVFYDAMSFLLQTLASLWRHVLLATYIYMMTCPSFSRRWLFYDAMSFLLQTLGFLWPHVLLATDVGFSMTQCPSCRRRWRLYDVMSFVLTSSSLWSDLFHVDIGFSMIRSSWWHRLLRLFLADIDSLQIVFLLTAAIDASLTVRDIA